MSDGKLLYSFGISAIALYAATPPSYTRICQFQSICVQPPRLPQTAILLLMTLRVVVCRGTALRVRSPYAPESLIRDAAPHTFTNQNTTMI